MADIVVQNNCKLDAPDDCVRITTIVAPPYVIKTSFNYSNNDNDNDNNDNNNNNNNMSDHNNDNDHKTDSINKKIHKENVEYKNNDTSLKRNIFFEKKEDIINRKIIFNPEKKNSTSYKSINYHQIDNFFEKNNISNNKYNISKNNYNKTKENKNKTIKQKVLSGFLIDLLEEISNSKDILFNLTLKEAQVGYGFPVENLVDFSIHWTGLIGDLVRNDTDMILAPLIMTEERMKAVDFSLPFDSIEALFVFKPRQDRVINNLQDLQNISDIKFGVRKDGAIQRYLREGKRNNVEMTEWSKKMDENPLLPPSNSAGVARAQKNDNYAFLVEDYSVRNVLRSKPCNLKFIRTHFYKKKLSLAVQKCSPLEVKINSAILEMEDNGKFDILKNKWWKKNECSGNEINAFNFWIFFFMLFLNLK